jgi:mannose-6-phosphate isomerase-like protein (cupin superfamily)
MNHVVETATLPVLPVGPAGSDAVIFNGGPHEFPETSLMLGRLLPGEGPAMHRHPYGEAFVISEGLARFTIDGVSYEAGPGQIVLVPAGVPHDFVNAGTAELRIVAVHVAPKVEIEWIEPPWTPGRS